MTNFDTYTFIKSLQETGMPERQAKAISDGLKESQHACDFATKSDLLCLKSEMQEFKSEMQEFKSEMQEFKAEMKEFKSEMYEFKVEIRSELACLESRLDRKISDVAHHQTKMMGGMTMGAVALMTLIDRYLPPNLASIGEYLATRLT
jgi:chromosome segregation ATPase